MNAAPPTCRSCGRPLDRRLNERLAAFQARRICSMKSCTGKGAIPPDFPGAIRADRVPACCGHCGGPWRIRIDGVSCVVCGRSHIVVEALLALAARGAR